MRIRKGIKNSQDYWIWEWKRISPDPEITVMGVLPCDPNSDLENKKLTCIASFLHKEKKNSLKLNSPTCSNTIFDIVGWRFLNWKKNRIYHGITFRHRKMILFLTELSVLNPVLCCDVIFAIKWRMVSICSRMEAEMYFAMSVRKSSLMLHHSLNKLLNSKTKFCCLDERLQDYFQW